MSCTLLQAKSWLACHNKGFQSPRAIERIPCDVLHHLGRACFEHFRRKSLTASATLPLHPQGRGRPLRACYCPLESLVMIMRLVTTKIKARARYGYDKAKRRTEKPKATYRNIKEAVYVSRPWFCKATVFQDRKVMLAVEEMPGIRKQHRRCLHHHPSSATPTSSLLSVTLLALFFFSPSLSPSLPPPLPLPSNILQNLVRQNRPPWSQRVRQKNRLRVCWTLLS